MESRNKFEMCRLCLCENECFVNIFEMNDWQGYVASEVISDLLQFQVSETDGYPHVVCLTCLTKLTDFKLFKECCQKSKDTYGNMFALHESVVEHKPEIVDFFAVKEEPIHHSDNEDNDSKSLEQTAHYCTSLAAVDADSCNSTFTTNNESIFDKSKSTSICVKVEALSSEAMEGSAKALIPPGERTYLTTFSQQDMSIAKERDKDEGDTEGEGERQTNPEKGVIEERERFKCFYCGSLLKTKVCLIRHMELHGLGITNKCEVCGKRFTSNSKHMIHMRSHTGDKPYKCEECSKSFSASGSLNRHMQTHTGSKPYKCAECSKSFTQLSTLKIHLRIHTGFKPYKCVKCRKSFISNGTLNRHVKIHTGPKPYKCSECIKTFRLKTTLKKHLRTHTGS